MKTASLLERYRSMASLSGQMLEAARQSEWDRLVELEQIRNMIEADLRRVDTLSWQGPDSVQKGQLIGAILAADQEVKSLAEAWIGGMQGTLGKIGMEKKLIKAYETP